MDFCVQFYRAGKPIACGPFSGCNEFEAKAKAKTWIREEYPRIKWDRIEVLAHGET